MRTLVGLNFSTVLFTLVLLIILVVLVLVRVQSG
jgi:hypothetical protein